MTEGNMEFRLINPNETGFLKHIEWNSEEIKGRVREMMESYKGVVYTEDTMKAAKDDRAALNKLKKAIEDRRKEVKRRCMEPYEQFEKEVKDMRTARRKRSGKPWKRRTRMPSVIWPGSYRSRRYSRRDI